MSNHYGRTKARLTKAAEAMKRRLDFQQFGQDNDSAVWQGSTACTHTICQALYYIWFGKVITLNKVNSLAGMPVLAHDARGKPRGMNSLELQRFFDAAHLPYVVRFGFTWKQLLAYSNRGPVVYAMRYGSAPEWFNYVYNGHRSTRPYALHGGKTQLTGAETIRHAVLLLGYRQVLSATGKLVAFHIWRKEPNHHSPSRQERPPFDVITAKQGNAEYDAYTLRLGNTPYAAIPTRSLPVPVATRLMIALRGLVPETPEDLPDEVSEELPDAEGDLPGLPPEGEVEDHVVTPTDADWDDGNAAVPGDVA